MQQEQTPAPLPERAGDLTTSLLSVGSQHRLGKGIDVLERSRAHSETESTLSPGFASESRRLSPRARSLICALLSLVEEFYRFRLRFLKRDLCWRSCLSSRQHTRLALAFTSSSQRLEEPRAKITLALRLKHLEADAGHLSSL